MLEPWPVPHLPVGPERSLSESFISEWPRASRYVVVREALEPWVDHLERASPVLKRLENVKELPEQLGAVQSLCVEAA